MKISVAVGKATVPSGRQGDTRLVVRQPGFWLAGDARLVVRQPGE